MTSFNQHLSDEDVLALVRRMEFEPKLLRRHLEEQIIASGTYRKHLTMKQLAS